MIGLVITLFFLSWEKSLPNIVSVTLNPWWVPSSYTKGLTRVVVRGEGGSLILFPLYQVLVYNWVVPNLGLAAFAWGQSDYLEHKNGPMGRKSERRLAMTSHDDYEAN